MILKRTFLLGLQVKYTNNFLLFTNLKLLMSLSLKSEITEKKLIVAVDKGFLRFSLDALKISFSYLVRFMSWLERVE